MDITRDNVLKWLKHGSTKPMGKTPHPESEKYKCPKSDECVMDCYHKKPHAYDEHFCNDVLGECKIVCVHEMIYDCIFFDEDFMIE